jgi:hypothetical protein
MIIVDTIDEEKDNGVFLKYPKCLYTVREEIQPPKEFSDLMSIMHKLSYKCKRARLKAFRRSICHNPPYYISNK